MIFSRAQQSRKSSPNMLSFVVVCFGIFLASLTMVSGCMFELGEEAVPQDRSIDGVRSQDSTVANSSAPEGLVFHSGARTDRIIGDQKIYSGLQYAAAQQSETSPVKPPSPKKATAGAPPKSDLVSLNFSSVDLV